MCNKILIILAATIIQFDLAQSNKLYKITDQIYFELTKNDEPFGRIDLGLFGEIAPKTVKNFKQLSLQGVDGQSYVGTKFLFAIQRFMIQGGDIVFNNGTGSASIFGPKFEDESFEVKHESAGILSMVNSAPNSNGCQFLITTMASPWLDQRTVAFGKVLEGQKFVHQIEHSKTDYQDRLQDEFKITRAGQVHITPFYEPAKNYDITLWEWLKAGWFPLSFSFAILAFFHYIIMQL